MTLRNDDGQSDELLLTRLAHWLVVAFDGDQARACAAVGKIEAADPDVAAAFRKARRTKGLRGRLEAHVAAAEQDRQDTAGR